jgi:hypothetical protein
MTEGSHRPHGILTFKIRLEQLLGPDARPATAKLLRAGFGRGKRGEGVIAFRILDSRQTTAGSERKARRSSTCSVASFNSITAAASLTPICRASPGTSSF